MRDLLFYVADKNTEGMLKGFLSRTGFQDALGTGFFDFDWRRDLQVAHGQNDSGLYTRARELMQPYVTSHRRAVVIMDAEWGGAPSAEQIEKRLASHLEDAGWPAERNCAIVIQPELENWIWLDSPVVCTQLGHIGTYADLRASLCDKGFWRQGEAKPFRPKEAMEHILKKNRIPRSSAIYQAIARHIGTGRCTDEAFARLRSTLQGWFPRQPREAGHRKRPEL